MTVLLAGSASQPPGTQTPDSPTVQAFAARLAKQQLQPRLQVVWAGADGSRWTLSGDLDAPVRLAGGFKGWSMPSFARATTASPALPGTRWRRSMANEREVAWLLGVYGEGQEMLDTYAAFMASLSPDRLGSLEVWSPNGTCRTLALRFVSDNDPTMDWDLTLSGMQALDISLVAEQPFWSGTPVELLWENRPDPTPPYPRPGQHDPYVLHLSNGRTLANATVTNAGVEAYPVWTLTGPFDSAAVGVDGRQVQLPFGLLAGESVVLDSDPARLVATRNDGLDLTALLGEADWAAVPPGESVPLSLEMVGAGSVALSLPQRFYRAW